VTSKSRMVGNFRFRLVEFHSPRPRVPLQGVRSPHLKANITRSPWQSPFLVKHPPLRSPFSVTPVNSPRPNPPTPPAGYLRKFPFDTFEPPPWRCAAARHHLLAIPPFALSPSRYCSVLPSFHTLLPGFHRHLLRNPEVCLFSREILCQKLSPARFPHSLAAFLLRLLCTYARTESCLSKRDRLDGSNGAHRPFQNGPPRLFPATPLLPLSVLKIAFQNVACEVHFLFPPLLIRFFPPLNLLGDPSSPCFPSVPILLNLVTSQNPAKETSCFSVTSMEPAADAVDRIHARRLPLAIGLTLNAQKTRFVLSLLARTSLESGNCMLFRFASPIRPL